MPLSISKMMKNADVICDYIPIVSTVSNTIDIIEKIVLDVVSLFSRSASKSINKNRYFKHLKDKPYLDCIFLLLPFYNVEIAKSLNHLKKDKNNIRENGRVFLREMAQAEVQAQRNVQQFQQDYFNITVKPDIDKCMERLKKCEEFLQKCGLAEDPLSAEAKTIQQSLGSVREKEKFLEIEKKFTSFEERVFIAVSRNVDSKKLQDEVFLAIHNQNYLAAKDKILEQFPCIEGLLLAQAMEAIHLGLTNKQVEGSDLQRLRAEHLAKNLVMEILKDPKSITKRLPNNGLETSQIYSSVIYPIQLHLEQTFQNDSEEAIKKLNFLKKHSKVDEYFSQQIRKNAQKNGTLAEIESSLNAVNNFFEIYYKTALNTVALSEEALRN